MKSLILIAASIFAVSAFAQKKMGTAPTMTMSSGYSNAELIASAGLVASAINLGAQYNKLSASDLGFGGYFFLQTSKEKNNSPIVYQVMSFGGQMKASLVRSSAYEAYITPGFGIHMIKDAPDTSAASGKSDVTWLGPTMRIGVLRTISPTMKLGLDRLEVWNWLDDKLAVYNTEAYSVALSIEM